MELMMRGRDHEEILGMNMRSNTSTLDHCNSTNRDSSPKQLSSASPIREIRPRDHGKPATNQTLDHRHSPSYQRNKPRRDSNVIDYNPDPNLDPDPITPIAGVDVVSSSSVRYRKCLKNHAASSGGHVLDGCGEFMPSGDDGTSEALKCAACECHRSFHLKEIDGESYYNPNYQLSRNNYNKNNNNSILLPHQHYLPPPPAAAPLQPNQNPHHHHHHHHDHPNSDHHHHHHHDHPNSDHHHPQYPVHRQRRPISSPVMVAFGGAQSSSEDLNTFDHAHNVGQSKAAGAIQRASWSKKRFRTKFNQEQKEKMMNFVEKLGWRIQKHDDQEVQRFCSEVGVKRQVFKVWMHNNKQAMKKKQV